MLDKYKREINYLRISVTDRCNLRCTYCMPETGVKLIKHNDILSYEEIIKFVKFAASKGINKIRLTGGEPLVRKGIIDLVKMISEIPGIKDFGMTTNAIFMDKFAEPLVRAGLHRINISLDTLEPEKYHKITKTGDIQKVFKGIEAAKNAGLEPIKINCVIKNSSLEKDAQEVKEFCKKNGLQVRFIHLMNLDDGSFSAVEGGTGGNCKICNRLRLTANGLLKPCLFSDFAYNIRELGIETAFQKAIENKPKSGTVCHTNKFYNIGG